MPTIKEIAVLAGVSRGTVDRVINNRGSVHPDKERKVMEIVKAMNYTPDRAGKTLAIKRKRLKFGYALFSSTSSNPFFLDVVNGIKNRAAQLSEYGVRVEIRYSVIDDPGLQTNLIDGLVRDGIAGLAITPINHPMVTKRLRQLTKTDIPVVTANTDLPDCGRIAYVGSDYYKSGETAAGLMNMLCAGRARVGIITGSPLVLCHSERIAGFMSRIETQYAGIDVVATDSNHDDDIESFVVTTRMLEAHPEIDALFLSAAGVVGACRAVEKLGLRGRIKVVGYDATAPEIDLIRQGVISAAITQEPEVQGAKPLDILLDYIGHGIQPEREFYYTSIGIKIRENL